MQQEAETSQDKILYQIKRRGPLTAKMLADTLQMTSMGIRQHLAQLEHEGLVRNLAEQPAERGRPVKPWDLTAAGHARFPDAHAAITLELITSVRDVFGEAALNELIDHKAEESAKVYANQLRHLSTIEQKANRLAEIRTAEGYMARIEPTSDAHSYDWLLIEDHCPICIAAESCQGFCRRELEVFQSLFTGQAEVSRDEHLLAGARRCTYRITPIP